MLHRYPFVSALAVLLTSVLGLAAPAGQIQSHEVTVRGGLQCNGMCLPAPKQQDHVLVVFAVDGSPEIAAKVKEIMDSSFPEKGQPRGWAHHASTPAAPASDSSPHFCLPGLSWAGAEARTPAGSDGQAFEFDPASIAGYTNAAGIQIFDPA